VAKGSVDAPSFNFHFPVSIFQYPRFFTAALYGKLNDYWARFLRRVRRSPRVLEAPAE
jgi:hypothetical protein